MQFRSMGEKRPVDVIANAFVGRVANGQSNASAERRCEVTVRGIEARRILDAQE